MQNSIYKRFVLVMFVAIACVVFSLFLTQASAAQISNGFGTGGNDGRKSSFANAYGWDTTKYSAKEWTSGGKTYTRLSGYQTDYMEDVYTSMTTQMLSTDEMSISTNGSTASSKTTFKEYVEKYLEEKNIQLGVNCILSNDMNFGNSVGGQRVVAVAQHELNEWEAAGTHTAIACTDGGTTGENKYSVYYNYNKGDPWCACFLSWCFEQAGYCNNEDTTKNVLEAYGNASAIGRSLINGHQCSSTIITETCIYKEGGYEPLPGDVVLYIPEGCTLDKTQHVGIVAYTDSSGIHTIEGNTSGAEHRNPYGVATRILTKSYCHSNAAYGFGEGILIVHPNWPAETTSESETTHSEVFTITGFTATDAEAAQGQTIAVDPDVIPYGTTVYISGKAYIAEDCDKAISGKKIGIFFDNEQDAANFGTHQVVVKW